jgi:ribonuclease HI
LRAKYFPGKSILEAYAKNGISYTWRSILKGVELLKEGLIWRIGDGRSVNIWRDPWIPRNHTRKVLTPCGASLLQKVADLINPVSGTWDEQLLRETFWEEDVKIILTLPLVEDAEDFLAWHPDPKGIFSVKSAYSLGVRIRDQRTGADASSSSVSATSFDWKKIWRLKVANKIKVFIWQLAHNSLPVKVNIAKRGIQLDTLCPVCRRFDEDLGHLFFKCKSMRLCWQLLNLEGMRELLLSQGSVQDILDKIWGCKEDIQQKIVILLWCWWSARNKLNAGERMKSPHEVTNDVLFHMKAWCLAQHQGPSNAATPSYKPVWRRPPEKFYKINCDGAFLVDSNKGGWGFVIRDHTGQVIAAGAGFERNLMSAQHSEAIACLKGLEHAAFLGMQNIIIETDAAAMVKACGDNSLDRSPISMLCREISAKMHYEFSACCLSYCPRTCNRVAHLLAALGLCNVNGPVYWQDQIPESVALVVSSDLVGHCV